MALQRVLCDVAFDKRLGRFGVVHRTTDVGRWTRCMFLSKSMGMLFRNNTRDCATGGFVTCVSSVVIEARTVDLYTLTLF